MSILTRLKETKNFDRDLSATLKISLKFTTERWKKKKDNAAELILFYAQALETYQNNCKTPLNIPFDTQ